MTCDRNEKNEKMNTKKFPILSGWSKLSQIDFLVSFSTNWDWWMPIQGRYKNAWREIFSSLLFFSHVILFILTLSHFFGKKIYKFIKTEDLRCSKLHNTKNYMNSQHPKFPKLAGTCQHAKILFDSSLPNFDVYAVMNLCYLKF